MAVGANPGAPRSKRVKAIEKRFGRPLKEILEQLYYDEGLTQAEVAKRLRVPRPNVGGWLIRFGINQRALAEQAGKTAADEVAV